MQDPVVRSADAVMLQAIFRVPDPAGGATESKTHPHSQWDALRMNNKMFCITFSEAPARMTVYRASFRMDTLR